ncbi:MAG: DUF2252 domain-containing protein [Thermoleophilaceae bacterium]|nr:DUF2252 domain-containing protein [Thermoleophilaceae bacterium]
MTDVARTNGFLTVEQRRDLGRAARKRIPRSALAAFEPLDDARDPVALLQMDDEGRLQDLVPIRYGRMLTTPFAFYRGAASLMANDLARKEHTDLFAQLCGDAHLSNFGLFAAPDRRLVFDCNDFDETLPGPWEWDLKRLAASTVIAGRSIGATEAESHAAVVALCSAYRDRVRQLADMSNLEVWHQRLEIDRLVELLKANARTDSAKSVTKMAEKAYTKDSIREFEKLTEVVDGKLRIAAAPPIIVPIEDVAKSFDIEISEEYVEAFIRTVIDTYKQRLLADRRHLLDQYEIVHMARKIVGVGSVGTRVWIVLLIGRDTNDPLFLQVKEAGPSVYERYLGKSDYEYAGQRVIAGQRLMQGASDPLLGWDNFRSPDGIDREFYVRQLKDWKGSAKIEKFTPEQLLEYASLCARVLARAHARSGDRVAIASYIGKGDALGHAIGDFAAAYADQNDRDYARMKEAVADGRIEVREGV